MPGTRTIDASRSLIQIFSGRTAMLQAVPDGVWWSSGSGIRTSPGSTSVPASYNPVIRLLTPMKPAVNAERGCS